MLLMMMGIGAYVTILPELLEKNVGSDFSELYLLEKVTIFGVAIDISSSLGMILIYILGDLTFSQQLLWSRLCLVSFIIAMLFQAIRNKDLIKYFKEEDGPYRLAIYRIIFFGLFTWAIGIKLFPVSITHGMEPILLPYASWWLNLVPISV